jgi:hypothetical protein
MDRVELEASLLSSIEPVAGPVGTAAAASLVALAKELGSDVEPGDPSWSFGLGGNGSVPKRRITLFLISTRGTFWVRWLNRWEEADVDADVAKEYQHQLVGLLGRSVMGRQMHTEKAVGLRTVARHLPALETLLRDTVAAVRTSCARRAVG